MDICNHAPLIKEVLGCSGDGEGPCHGCCEHISVLKMFLCCSDDGEGPCFVCATMDLQARKSNKNSDLDSAQYRYRFEKNQREFENLLMNTSISAIPASYLHLMRRLVNPPTAVTVVGTLRRGEDASTSSSMKRYATWMDICNHASLIKEVLGCLGDGAGPCDRCCERVSMLKKFLCCSDELEGPCIVCAVNDLQARREFTKTALQSAHYRYRFEQNKREFVTLLMNTCAEAIPASYLHLMRQLVNPPKEETDWRTLQCGANSSTRSSMSIFEASTSEGRAACPGSGDAHPDDVLPEFMPCAPKKPRLE